jgi:sulfonate transport system substrate-binding protein
MKNIKTKATIILILLFTIGIITVYGSRNDNINTNNSGKELKSSNTDGLVIRVADFQTSAWNDQLKIAVAKGYINEEFAKDNISVEVSNFANGPAVNEAFTAKKVDFVIGIGDQPLIAGIANGLDVRILSTINRQEKTISLVASKSSNITKVEELKGKKVGVYIGTNSHKSLIGVLDDHGLKANDYEVANITSGNDGLSALSNGDIDAYLASEPYVTTAVESGVGKPISDITGHPCMGYLVGLNEFIKKYPEVTERFIKVLNKTHKWSLENPDEANQILAKATNLKPEQIKLIIPRVDRSLGFTEDSISHLKETHDFLIEQGMIKNKINIDDYIDKSFIDKVFKDDGK